MANPFLGEQSLHTPSHINDPVGDDSWIPSTPYHIAGLLVFALVILVLLKQSGFRAMVGIGRS